MAQITVNSNMLKNKATELQGYNKQLNSQITAISNQESSLCGMWEGDAKQAFDKEFKSDIKQMQNFYNAIEKFVNQLNEIAKNYDTAERKNLQTAQTRKYR